MLDDNGRFEIWQKTLPLLKDTWLLGDGPGTFALYYPNLGTQDPNVGSFVDRPHSLYLQMAHGCGNLAAILFIVGLGWVCWRARRSPALAGVVGFAVAGLFNDSNVGTASVFWCLLGVGLAASQ